MSAGLVSGAARQIWLRSWWWDASCLAFCWVPFYIWVVFGLGLGKEGWGLSALDGYAAQAALALATTAALGITYIHRHYTLLLVYGDSATFMTRARAFLIAPVVLLGVIAAARWGKYLTLIQLGPLTLTSWGLIVTVGTLWNIWHTVQQRYGILRTYAGRSQAGLHSPEHARRDFWLLWSLIALVSVLVLLFQRSTFGLHRSTQFVDETLGPFLNGTEFRVLVLLVSAIALAAFARWLRHELAAELRLSERLPRWAFLGSTLMLLAVFVIHGPLVGYLCFAVAHALEYLAFVHHFGQKKYSGQGATRGLASRLFAKPWLSAPLLIVGLVSLYALLRSYKGADAYVVYYITTSFLHFLYDGWIWKVRKSHVAKPLGIHQPAAVGGTVTG